MNGLDNTETFISHKRKMDFLEKYGYSYNDYKQWLWNIGYPYDLYYSTLRKFIKLRVLERKAQKSLEMLITHLNVLSNDKKEFLPAYETKKWQEPITKISLVNILKGA